MDVFGGSANASGHQMGSLWDPMRCLGSCWALLERSVELLWGSLERSGASSGAPRGFLEALAGSMGILGTSWGNLVATCGGLKSLTICCFLMYFQALEVPMGPWRCFGGGSWELSGIPWVLFRTYGCVWSVPRGFMADPWGDLGRFWTLLWELLRGP